MSPAHLRLRTSRLRVLTRAVLVTGLRVTLNLCIEGIRLIAPPGLQFEAQHGSPLTGVKMWPKGLWDRQEGSN